LKFEKKDAVIRCRSERGPNFLEIPAADNCHANSRLTRIRSVPCECVYNNDDCEERDGCPFEKAKVVTLVQSDAPLHVPASLLVSKCDQFADDPGLAAFPSHWKSQVALSDFQEVLSALDDRTEEMTDNNLKGLSQLCEEFQFRASENLKQDAEAQMTEIHHRGTFFVDWFMFTLENAIFESGVGQAIPVSPAVREQLSVDACPRTFACNDVRAFDRVG
jgi:hypothetical protein